MKIIDYELCGNVVRLYYGPNSGNQYHGDDWDDRPLNNCGMVYLEYVSGTVDIAFGMDSRVLDPEKDWHYQYNVPYCKNDFKARVAPCFVVVPPEVVKDDYDPSYSRYAGTEKGLRIYFGDDLEETLERVEKHGGAVLGRHRKRGQS